MAAPPSRPCPQYPPHSRPLPLFPRCHNGRPLPPPRQLPLRLRRLHRFCGQWIPHPLCQSFQGGVFIGSVRLRGMPLSPVFYENLLVATALVTIYARRLFDEMLVKNLASWNAMISVFAGLTFAQLHRLRPGDPGDRLPTLLLNRTIHVTGVQRSNFTLDNIRVTYPDVFNNDAISTDGIGGVLDYKRYGFGAPSLEGLEQGNASLPSPLAATTACNWQDK